MSLLLVPPWMNRFFKAVGYAAIFIPIFTLGYLGATARAYALCANYWERTVADHYRAFGAPVPSEPPKWVRRRCLNEAAYIMALPKSWRLDEHEGD